MDSQSGSPVCHVTLPACTGLPELCATGAELVSRMLLHVSAVLCICIGICAVHGLLVISKDRLCKVANAEFVNPLCNDYAQPASR